MLTDRTRLADRNTNSMSFGKLRMNALSCTEATRGQRQLV
jgi:hypothetical protein